MVQVSLKSDKTLYISDQILLSFSYTEECFRQKVVEKIKTYSITNNFFFFSKIVPFVR